MKSEDKAVVPQEPVACETCGKEVNDGKVRCALGRHCWVGQQPAQPAAWVGLTDAERRKLFDPLHDAPFEFAKRIEAKLREKNAPTQGETK